MIRMLLRDGSRARVGTIPRWALVLVGIAAAGMGVLILLLAAGLALVLLPVALAGGLVAHWVARRRLRAMAAARPRPAPADRGPAQPLEIIDAEYRIVDEEKR